MSLSSLYPLGGAVPVPRSRLAAVTSQPEQVDIYLSGTAPLREVVEEMLAYPDVRVYTCDRDEARGVLPVGMAVATGVTVYNVTVSTALASDLSRECAEAARHVPVHSYLVTDLDVSYPGGSVLNLSAATMVARLVGSSAPVPLAGAIVCLHGAEADDAYMRVLRTLAQSLGASRVVECMAEDEEGCGELWEEEEARSGVIRYESGETPETWDPSEPGKPWSARNITRAAALFVDCDEQAYRLVAAYRALGLDAYRLNVRSDASRYAAVRMALEDPGGRPVVLIVDSSYRTGFRWPVSEIIDSGLVRTCAPGGERAFVFRRVTPWEEVSALSRGARGCGVVTRAYAPYAAPRELESRSARLEVEAAAFLMRCLGYRPPGEYASAVMATVNLRDRRDAVAALNGILPLWELADAPESMPERVPTFADAVRHVATLGPGFRVAFPDACQADRCVDLGGVRVPVVVPEISNFVALPVSVSQRAEAQLAFVADMLWRAVRAVASGNDVLDSLPARALRVHGVEHLPSSWSVPGVHGELQRLVRLAGKSGFGRLLPTFSVGERERWLARLVAHANFLAARVQGLVVALGADVAAGDGREFPPDVQLKLALGVLRASAYSTECVSAGVLAREVAATLGAAVGVAPLEETEVAGEVARYVDAFGSLFDGTRGVARVLRVACATLNAWQMPFIGVRGSGRVAEAIAARSGGSLLEFPSPWTGFACVLRDELGRVVAVRPSRFVADFVGPGFLPSRGGLHWLERPA